MSSVEKKIVKIDKVRDRLATKNDVPRFKKTYERDLSKMENLNTGKFWNKKFSVINPNLSYQDGMTKDRVKTAYNFIPKNAKKVLDIGAGLGFIEELLSKNSKVSITGIDVSSEAIQSLRGRFRGKFEWISLYKINFSSDSFDVILALEVLEHIPPSKVFSVLKKVNKFLKPGGYFILSVPMNEELEKMETNPNSHLRAYTEPIIIMELELIGFKIIQTKKLFAFNTFYSVKSKIISRIFKNKWKPNNIVIKAKKQK